MCSGSNLYNQKKNFGKHFSFLPQNVEVRFITKSTAKGYFEQASHLNTTIDSTTRTHFAVTDNIVNAICEQQPLQDTRPHSRFLETVFDTRNLELLSAGLWLIYRDDKPKLRYVEKTSQNTITWREVLFQ